MAEIKLTGSNFEKEALRSDRLVLIDFWAEWCGPCRMLAPVISEIAEEHPEWKVCKVNVDEEASLAARYGVSSIPTVIRTVFHANHRRGFEHPDGDSHGKRCGRREIGRLPAEGSPARRIGTVNPSPEPLPTNAVESGFFVQKSTYGCEKAAKRNKYTLVN